MTTKPTLPFEIDVRATKQLLDQGQIVLIDCREPSEYATAKIDGAILIPMREFPQRLAELETHKQSRVVVHCHHGGRSAKVTSYLRQNGFDLVQNMTGGIDQWSLEIDPTVPRYR